MRYTTIPGTTLETAVLCLGTADMGTKIPRDESLRLLDAYLDAGGDFIDTASVYSDWVHGEKSRVEKLLGEWMQSRRNRDEIILATKGAHPKLSSMTKPRMSRKDIEHDLNASLKNLRTDVIDLYWLHRDAPDHPVGDILETLNDQVKAGKIRAFGCSNWRTLRIKEAQDYAAQHGLMGFVANQPQWSVAVPDMSCIPDPTVCAMDEEMWVHHKATGLAAIPYSSQANGLFHKWAQGKQEKKPHTVRVYHRPENRQRFERMQQLSKETGLTVTQIVLGYLLSQPFTTIPIVGPRTLEQWHDSLSAVGVRLDEAQLQFIERSD
jgi:aryl-alcohol dehydrogenase-like predicted oxidoreductase